MKSNLKRFGKYILLLSSVLILIFSLTACNNSYDFSGVPGGDSSKPTESNGGQVVKQGNYLYFVNGKTTNEVDNTYNSVVKGAIVRATIKEDGSLEGFTTVVPKNVYAASKESGNDGGFYIFGNSIYYMTPNDEIDKNNNRLNDRLDVMKCNIDGTGTVKLGTPHKALDYQYKFVNGYLVTYQTNTITIFRLEEGLPVVKTISDVTGLLIPKTEKYEADKEYVSDYIFYTRELTEEERDLEENYDATNNVVCAVKCDGTNAIEIINGKTTFKGERNTFKISLKTYLVKDDNTIVLYYTRVGDVPEAKEKIYSYTFTLNALKEGADKVYFDSNNEKLIANNTITSIIPYSDDTVLEVNNKVIYAYENGVRKTLSIIINGEGTFDGTFVTLKREANADYMLYTNTAGFQKVQIATNGKVETITKRPQLIYDASLANNVFGNELVGDYFYFSNTTKLDYVYRVNVNIDSDKIYTAGKIEEGDTSRISPELVGIMTDTDKKTLEDKEKENK